MTPFSNPLLLGFDTMEKTLERVAKSGDSYPPYNIERLKADGECTDRLRITLAVAGFTRDQLDVTVEENQLVIRGRQIDDKQREYLHRGIATRQFQRSFLLADGMIVKDATLGHGMLVVALERPQAPKVARRIEIRSL
jgi:HSP20 family molecular chaperone IbpA